MTRPAQAPFVLSLGEVTNEAVCGACESTAFTADELGGLLPHFCPTSSLRFGNALAGFLAQDSLGSLELGPAGLSERIQSLPYSFHLFLKTGVLVP